MGIPAALFLTYMISPPFTLSLITATMSAIGTETKDEKTCGSLSRSANFIQVFKNRAQSQDWAFFMSFD